MPTFRGAHGHSPLPKHPTLRGSQTSVCTRIPGSVLKGEVPCPPLQIPTAGAWPIHSASPVLGDSSRRTPPCITHCGCSTPNSRSCSALDPFPCAYHGHHLFISQAALQSRPQSHGVAYNILTLVSPLKRDHKSHSDLPALTPTHTEHSITSLYRAATKS